MSGLIRQDFDVDGPWPLLALVNRIYLESIGLLIQEGVESALLVKKTTVMATGILLQLHRPC